MTGLIVDNFAGGGGASTGIEQNPTHFETACQRIAAALEGTAQ